MKQPLLICAVVALVGCGKKHDGNTGVINPNKPSPKAVPVNIADPIVEKAIRKSLKKPTGELTKADLEKVTKLYLKYNQLTEVPKGLEKLNQLTHLILSYNQLTDVTGLEKLTKLKWLSLKSNQLTEIPKGLENLTKLKWLFVDFNQLADVQGLEKLPQLTGLFLDFNQLTELPKGLEKLTNLEGLYLANNRLTEVTGLEKLSQLEELSVESNFDLTKAQIDELQKALPKCEIHSNPTK